MKKDWNLPQLVQAIEHTLLKPEAGRGQVVQLCEEAVEYGFHGICVNPCYIADCQKLLLGTPVRIVSVIGFPLGANLTATKVAEAKHVLEAGAHEVDMVMWLGAVKAQQWGAVQEDVAQVARLCHDFQAPLKVILETHLLEEPEIARATEVCAAAGATFVKTCTGFSGGGATVPAVETMSRHITSQMGIKASGGIRTLPQALDLLEAGATRLGMSASVSVVKEAQQVLSQK